MTLHWKQAKLAELYEIAYNDTEAPLEHKIAAGEEIKRRARQKHSRVNYKEKAVYPR